MAKLKCVDDNKRVHVISGKSIHRDGSKCTAPADGWVKIADKQYRVTSSEFHAS